jgi:hypothetical protein
VRHRHVADAHHLTQLDQGPCAKQELPLVILDGDFLDHTPQGRSVEAEALGNLRHVFP